jgi:sugar phosphate isomerase/epimerase
MNICCCFLYTISKYGYPPKLNDVFRSLEEMKEMGFHNVELEGVREENLQEVYKARHELKARCGSLGLNIINFCPVLPGVVSIERREREKNIDLFKRGLELAVYFGCATIQVDSFTPPLQFVGDAPYKEMISFGKEFKVIIPEDFVWQEQWDALVDGISRCNALAKSAGLPLCLEPRVGEIITNTDAMLRLMDAVNDDNFGAVFDTGHQHAQKEILPLSVEKLGNRIFYLHLSDNNGLTNEHLALGKGTIDWEGLFTALKKQRFNGYVAIDVGNVPEIETAYVESRIFLENLASRLNL